MAADERMEDGVRAVRDDGGVLWVPSGGGCVALVAVVKVGGVVCAFESGEGARGHHFTDCGRGVRQSSG